jgi:hypothetical protein
MVWPNLELNLIDQARHLKSTDAHQTYQGTWLCLSREMYSMGHARLSKQRYDKLSRGEESCASLKRLVAPCPSEQIPGWTYRGGVA